MRLTVGFLEKKLKLRMPPSSIWSRRAIAKSTTIPRRTHLTRCGATIEVPAADRRYFSANKRIQHERRTQHGGGTSRIRGEVASCRGRGSRQQRPRQGQGTFDS